MLMQSDSKNIKTSALPYIKVCLVVGKSLQQWKKYKGGKTMLLFLTMVVFQSLFIFVFNLELEGWHLTFNFYVDSAQKVMFVNAYL